jgi:hypothetical protein
MAKKRVNPVGVLAVPKESKQQESLFEWMSWVRVPILRKNLTEEWVALTDIAFAVPNGASIAGDAGQRARYMAALKRQGFKVGVSDIVIPYPTVAYHGLFIELKRDKNSKVSDDQLDWQKMMRRLDYKSEIVVGWDAAVAVIREYLGPVSHRMVMPSAVSRRASGDVVV